MQFLWNDQPYAVVPVGHPDDIFWSSVSLMMHFVNCENDVVLEYFTFFVRQLHYGNPSKSWYENKHLLFLPAKILYRVMKVFTDDLYKPVTNDVVKSSLKGRWGEGDLKQWGWHVLPIMNYLSTDSQIVLWLFAILLLSAITHCSN